MAKLDIGVGEEFPLEEKPHAEGCAHGLHGHHHFHHHHHHHHEALRDMWRRHFGRGDAHAEKPTEEKDKE